MRLCGEINLPGDKSISHRAIMLNSISYGQAKIYNFLNSEDCLATINIFKDLGVKINFYDDYVLVTGNGFTGLKKPKNELNCFNSGTTARLMMGILSGLDFDSILIGDSSLSKRPMLRVAKHLEKMNVNILLKDKNFLPAHILPSKVNSNEVFLDVSSAQVKSAVILSALKCKEETVIHELETTRNHTELMLKYLNADIKVNGLKITVSGKNKLFSKDIYVPGDISSAAFFIVAALITPNSEILIKNCGINPTRIGIFNILDMINADYKILNKKEVCNELVGDILVKYKENLLPFTIQNNLVPLLIDEIPILSLLATQIDGVSIIKDAKELRVKESDRIKSTTSELNKIGANITECEDGMIIHGKTNLIPNNVTTYNDHRISMMLKVAKIICQEITIDNSDCDKISYPNFENDLTILLK